MGESIKIFEVIDEDLASDNFDNLGETEGDDLVKRQHYNTIRAGLNKPAVQSSGSNVR